MAEGNIFGKISGKFKLGKLKLKRAFSKIKGIFKSTKYEEYKLFDSDEEVDIAGTPQSFVNTLPRIVEEDESDIASTATFTQEISVIPSTSTVQIEAIKKARRHSFANIFNRDTVPRNIDKRRSLVVTGKYPSYRDTGRELRRHSLSRADMEAIIIEKRAKRVSLVQSMNGSDWEEVAPKLELDRTTLKRNSVLKDNWC
ncbi:hypothetical protein HDV01_007168 [Terramyces sp. JEL0728]|nr:hypothetical protein HDV01_007168 [Terramyces sp. JEL0728]